MRLLDGMPYIHSSGTNIGARFRKAGFKPPERSADEAERESRIEGALRAMKKIQAEKPSNVLPLSRARKS